MEGIGAAVLAERARAGGRADDDGRWHCVSLNYPSTREGLASLAARVAADVDASVALLAGVDATDGSWLDGDAAGVDVTLHAVTHSLGGVVVRAVAARHLPGARWGRLCLLAPPSRGSRAARWLVRGPLGILTRAPSLAIFGPVLADLAAGDGGDRGNDDDDDDDGGDGDGDDDDGDRGGSPSPTWPAATDLPPGCRVGIVAGSRAVGLWPPHPPSWLATLAGVLGASGSDGTVARDETPLVAPSDDASSVARAPLPLPARDDAATNYQRPCAACRGDDWTQLDASHSFLPGHPGAAALASRWIVRGTFAGGG